MLCFLFAALIVAVDQFFKQWIMNTLEIGVEGPELIPGILGLTRWDNDGAMLGILSGQQWLLAGIAFAAAIVLIMILLRYNEGFWGTLGLAAVLGGTIGNLIDRIFNDGKVVDMFRTLFINFPIFNIADIFITLGFITFLIHFIAISFKGSDREQYAGEYEDEANAADYGDSGNDEFPDINSVVAAQVEQELAGSSAEHTHQPQQHYAADAQYQSDPQYQQQYAADAQYPPDPQYASGSQFGSESVMPVSSDYEPITDTSPDLAFSLDDLSAELDSLDDYNVDDILREYGFEDNDNL